jgi:hypothetical protein
MTTGAHALIARYAAAWNGRDAEACAACFAPTGVREWRVLAPLQAPGGRFARYVGREAVARGIRELLVALPDLELAVPAVSQGSDGRIWTEWRMRGTHLGDWGPWPARGEAVDFCGVSIYVPTGLGFLEERMYWDQLLMTRGHAAAVGGVAGS